MSSATTINVNKKNNKMALFRNGEAFYNFGKCVLNTYIKDIGRRDAHRYVAPTIKEINRRIRKAGPLPPEKVRRSNFTDWNLNAEIFAFGKRLGEEFKIELLLQAFVHRSYVVLEELKQEQVGIASPSLGVADNENLAKEGQVIISSQVKRYLSHSFPMLPVEGIDAIHDYLLSDETLGNIAKNMGATDIILSADYPVELETYAKTLKAIVGALAQSQSVEKADIFVRDFVLTVLAEKDVNEFFEISEPLKVLTDILARDNQGQPEPRLIGQSAMNEILASYTVGIYADRKLIGQGPGESVEVAVEMAARDALKQLFRTSDDCKPLRFDVAVANSSATNLSLSEWRASAFNR